ncbi:hypothetical protein RB809 [Rhodopirellula baltica SH 1]|uniref:Uncharacterized protein n=1 Tax=Rhodopirellula baltica (strain DSM 10527 / NCIMB 13988 / SH1) TaxID=243090 RepID=Q7UY87_RHOBA|nr:hypothetical protein RB809 [Rhodopirellula baltica SH 1]
MANTFGTGSHNLCRKRVCFARNHWRSLYSRFREIFGFVRTLKRPTRLSLRTHKSHSTDERVKSFLMSTNIESSRLEQKHEGSLFASLAIHCEPSNSNAPAYPRRSHQISEEVFDCRLSW